MPQFDAEDAFRDVRQDFSDGSTAPLSILQSIAKGAVKMATSATWGGDDTLDDPSAFTRLTDTNIKEDLGFTSGYSDPGSIDSVTTDSISIFSLATDFIEELRSQALQGATFPDYGQIVGNSPDAPPTPSFDMTEPTLYTIDAVEPPGTINIPEWDDASAWTGGEIRTGEVGADTTIGPMVAPFAWTGTSYTSKLMSGGVNVLYEALKADIQSSTYGVDTLDDGRVYDRFVARETRALSSALEDATRLTTLGGFTAPSGATTYHTMRALVDYRDKVTAANRDVLSQKAALLLEAKKVAWASGLQMETLEQGFYHADMDRLLKRIAQEITSTVEVGMFNLERLKMHVAKYAEFARVYGERIRAEVAKIDVFKSQVEAEATKANANKAIVEEFATKNKVLVDLFMAQLEGFKSVVDGRVRYHGVLADVYKSYVSQLNTATDATKGAYDLVDRQYRTAVEYAVGKYNANIAKSKLKLDSILGAVSQKVERMKLEVQSATSLAASAMSALNVNLGLSLSASANVGGQDSYSTDLSADVERKSTSTTYSYDQTKSTESRSRQVMEYTSENENYNYNYTGN